MTDGTIFITDAGTGSITLNGSSRALTASTVPEVRSAAIRHAAEHARTQGRPVTLTAHEPGGSFRLAVSPDGRVESLPEAPEPTWEQAPQQEPQSIDPAPAPAGDRPNAFTVSTATQGKRLSTPEEVSAQPDAPKQTDPTPTVAEDDPLWRERAAQPATQGARGTLNKLGLKMAASEAELAERRAVYARELAEADAQQREEEERAQRDAQERAQQETRREARRREAAEAAARQRKLIQTNFQGTRTILIANPKGGARKTTTTYLLAATMGIIRGGSVVAWDANETVGTLAQRSAPDEHDRTVVDLLEQAADDFTSIEGSRLGTLDRFVRAQGDAHFTVLASDEDAAHQEIVDGDGFNRVHEILERFNRLILVDTGNNIRTSHFLAAVEAAHQLVIPVAASLDSAHGAQFMIDTLTKNGHADLIKNAVVLIHDLEKANAADQDYLSIVRQISDDFAGKVAAVLPVPFDDSLKGGKQIDHAQLAPATQRAYQEAAAAIAASLRNSNIHG